MENHPIPQDVTGFQFKLIGDMTVKQFAYLATCAILAWIFFVPPIPFFIKIPFVFFFVFLGLGLAFLPIEGRPMDTMIAHFIKALFKPTFFVYQKTGRKLFLSLPNQTSFFSKPPSAQDERLKVFLHSLPKQTKNKFDEREEEFFQSLFPPQKKDEAASPKKPSAPHIVTMQNITPLTEKGGEPKKEDLGEALKKRAIILEEELETAKIAEAKLRNQTAYSPAHQRVLDLEKELEETLVQKENLTRQILKLQQQLETQKKNIFVPTTANAPAPTQNVRRIPKVMGKTVGLPIAPETPNLVAGIIKDPRGNPLPNILVEIKDADDNPVRAFKTNGMGQFVSSTPLLNGLYTIEFEDPKEQNRFDAIELKIEGKVLLPLEIISIDEREELRLSLFGQNKK